MTNSKLEAQEVACTVDDILATDSFVQRGE